MTYGTRQIGIAYDLDDSALQRDLGPLVQTPLAEGIRQTLQHFRQLRDQGRLETTTWKDESHVGRASQPGHKRGPGWEARPTKNRRTASQAVHKTKPGWEARPTDPFSDPTPNFFDYFEKNLGIDVQLRPEFQFLMKRKYRPDVGLTLRGVETCTEGH